MEDYNQSLRQLSGGSPELPQVGPEIGGSREASEWVPPDTSVGRCWPLTVKSIFSSGILPGVPVPALVFLKVLSRLLYFENLPEPRFRDRCREKITHSPDKID